MYEAETKTIEYPIEIQNHEIKMYAYQVVTEKWGVEQWKYYNDLISRESGWNTNAQNPTSTAFGLHQFLNGTWQGGECIKTTDYKVQIDCGINM